jgi:hypothetical protein
MAELAVLHLVKSVGAKSTARGLTNQEAGAPPPLSFPHAMSSVERVKDNMRLIFIEKFFTNREIETSG